MLLKMLFKIYTLINIFFFLVSSELEVNKVEYQHNLNINELEGNLTNNINNLINWLDNKLEDEEFNGKLDIQKGLVNYNFREVTRVSLIDNITLLKYRKSLFGREQNDLIWKIRSVKLSDDNNLWYPNNITNTSNKYKLENNTWCNNFHRLEYSSYILFPYENEVFIPNNYSMLNYYYPNIGSYYNLSNKSIIKSKKSYEYIVDIPVKYFSNSKGKFTIQIVYNTLNDYDNNIISGIDKTELTYKLDKNDSEMWEKDLILIQDIYDYVQNYYWINQTNCLTTNTNEEYNYSLFIIFGLIIFVIFICCIINLS
jgi:hypothetical protein